MSFTDWVRETKERAREESIRTAIKASITELWLGGLRRIGRSITFGTPVYSRDWDILLILDACRPDLMGDVSGEYDFLPGTIPSITSVGSMSKEWMEHTFTPEYRTQMATTAYITGNPFSDDLGADDFGLLDEVWRYVWDDERNVIPPRAMTDRAIEMWRSDEHERMIVHYMQPHVPFRSRPDLFDYFTDADTFGDERNNGIWDQLRDGEVSHEEIWDGYRNNLQWVLDDVELLLSNVDADRVVISADHGNGMGEWGIHGHPAHIPLPVVRHVPWVTVSGTDDGEYQPDIDMPEEDESAVSAGEVADRLEALGYR